MGQVQSTLPELHQTRTGYSVVTVSIPGLYQNHNSHMCKPKVRKKRKQLSKCRKPENGARPSKDWLCEQLSARDDYDQDTKSNMAIETGGNIVLNGHTGLDMVGFMIFIFLKHILLMIRHYCRDQLLKAPSHQLRLPFCIASTVRVVFFS